jgi:magnesium chelatase subunit ChlD-like protein
MSHRSPRAAQGGSSLRWHTDAAGRQGHTPAITGGSGRAIDWPATLCAKRGAPLAPAHWRFRRQLLSPAPLQLVLLDTSGSMCRHGRLARAKGWTQQLIERAARHGDDVAVLGFGGQGAQWLLAPCSARRAAGATLRTLGGGGGTPLAAAMARAGALLQRRAPGPVALWLLTDGHCDTPPPPPQGLAALHIVDFDDPRAPLGHGAEWAAQWRARRVLP